MTWDTNAICHYYFLRHVKTHRTAHGNHFINLIHLTKQVLLVPYSSPIHVSHSGIRR